MALLDTLGIASILPFIAVLSKPEIIETNSILSQIYINLGFQNSQEFLFFLGLLVFVFLIFSLVFKTYTTYFQLKFALMREYSFSKKLVENYLHQPFSWYLNRNSSDLGKNILSEVNKVISGCVIPIMDLISQGAVVLAIVTFLIFIDPVLSVSIAFILSTCYLIIFKFIRKFLDRIGNERLLANHGRFNIINEAFGGIKEVKLGGLENFYIDRFSGFAKTFSYNQALSEITARVPRFILEGIAFGGVLIMVLYLLRNYITFVEIVPIISLYVFAGYRLLPSMQQIYSSFAQIRFSEPALTALYNDIRNIENEKGKIVKSEHKADLTQDIKLQNVSFSYPYSDKKTLTNLNLTIPAKKNVGFVGETGSGKTSTVDLLLGLLSPDAGDLIVDDIKIDQKNLRSWQNSIGYVPQNFFLVDDTLESNIAFGIPEDQINHELIERAAKISDLHHFVIKELPDGYKTKIGERGVRLSGGQKQRIAIARALYNDPKILIFDEATSALDNLTENIVMDAIARLSNKVTIIIITHRLSTLKICEKIYHFEKGKIRSSGTFEELIKQDSKFKSMALEQNLNI